MSLPAQQLFLKHDIENMLDYGAEALGLKTNKDDVSFLNDKAPSGLLARSSVKLGLAKSNLGR